MAVAAPSDPIATSAPSSGSTAISTAEPGVSGRAAGDVSVATPPSKPTSSRSAVGTDSFRSSNVSELGSNGVPPPPDASLVHRAVRGAPTLPHALIGVILTQYSRAGARPQTSCTPEERPAGQQVGRTRRPRRLP